LCHNHSRNPLQAQVTTWTPPPWDITIKLHTQSRRSLCSDVASAEHSRRSTNETNNSGHSAWWPCLIHRLTPLPRTRISETAKKGTPLLSHHQDHHCTKCANPRLHPHGPSAPPCQSRTKRATTAATQKATPPADHHHCYKSRWVSRCDAFKKGMTSMTPSSHVHKGMGFHPGISCCKNMVTLNGALNRESDAPRAPPPLPPTVEAYARNFTIATDMGPNFVCTNME
jgi:hypothetical protein